MKRDERNICSTQVRVTHLHHKRGPVASVGTLLLLLVFVVATAHGQTAPNATSQSPTGKIRYADQFTGADDTAKVQAAVNDLPKTTHDGVVIVPATMSPTMASVTLGTKTLVINYSTAQNKTLPTYWSGNGNSEFVINGPGGFNTPYIVLNNTGTGTVERGTGLVFRTGGVSAGIPGPLRNIWQLKAGNFGNATAEVNADDLVLYGWQGSTYTTGTITTITNGSNQVVGSGTSWTTALAGGNFKLDAQPTVGATVLSVESATSLTLAENWSGTTAGSGASYTITGGSSGTQRARLLVGQNGVYIFNPNRTSADPLVFASHNRGYVFGAPNGGSKTMYVRLNVFQPGGTTGIELRSSDSDGKRKFVVLDDSSNELRVMAADGTTKLTQLTDAGNYRVNGAVAVNDTTGITTKVNLSSTAKSDFALGINVGTGLAADGSGFKHQRGTAGCVTTAAAGATCTTVVTWNTAFANANYTAVCSGRGIASGVPLNGGLTAQRAASVTFQTVAATRSEAQYTNIDCVAVHD